MKLPMVRLLAVVSLPALVFAACGDDDDDASSTTTRGAGRRAPLEGDITVFAAASLTDVFDEARRPPSRRTTLASRSSSTSRHRRPARADPGRRPRGRVRIGEQLEHGPGRRRRRGRPTRRPSSTTSCRSPFPPATKPRSPASPTSPTPTFSSGCAPRGPLRQFGREALANAGVTPSVDTNEPDVRSLLTKIEAGELDAGIVYVTDVLAAGDAVEGIDIPADENVTATYPIAAAHRIENAEAADAFVEPSCCRRRSGDPHLLRLRRPVNPGALVANPQN